MSRAICSATNREGVETLDGVNSASATEATLEYDLVTVSLAGILNEIEEIEYEPDRSVVTVGIPGGSVQKTGDVHA
jgi:hypothetical protein